MSTRLIAAVLGVLGLAAIGLGVASATAWRAGDTLVATARAGSPNGTLVVTAPGVLEMGGGPVTVTARASGATKVVLAIGKETDVVGWVGTDPHTLIAGLADGATLRTEAVAGGVAAPAPAPAPDPDGSDMWVEQAAGKGAAELTWTPQPGRWSLLVAGAGAGAAAPTVVLSWPQTVTTPWLVPGVVVGAILLLAGLALGARTWLGARRDDRSVWYPVGTDATPVVAVAGSSSPATGRGSTSEQSPGSDDAPTVVLTRRQMREAAASVHTSRVSLGLAWRLRGHRGPDGETRPETGSLPEAVPPTTTGMRPPAAPAPVPDPATGASPRTSHAAATTATPGGSRADAWRRSWGFPGADSSDATDGTDGTAGPQPPTRPGLSGKDD